MLLENNSEKNKGIALLQTSTDLATSIDLASASREDLINHIQTLEQKGLVIAQEQQKIYDNSSDQIRQQFNFLCRMADPDLIKYNGINRQAMQTGLVTAIHHLSTVLQSESLRVKLSEEFYVNIFDRDKIPYIRVTLREKQEIAILILVTPDRYHGLAVKYANANKGQDAFGLIAEQGVDKINLTGLLESGELYVSCKRGSDSNGETENEDMDNTITQYGGGRVYDEGNVDDSFRGLHIRTSGNFLNMSPGSSEERSPAFFQRMLATSKSDKGRGWFAQIAKGVKPEHIAVENNVSHTFVSSVFKHCLKQYEEYDLPWEFITHRLSEYQLKKSPRLMLAVLAKLSVEHEPNLFQDINEVFPGHEIVKEDFYLSYNGFEDTENWNGTWIEYSPWIRERFMSTILITGRMRDAINSAKHVGKKPLATGTFKNKFKDHFSRIVYVIRKNPELRKYDHLIQFGYSDPQYILGMEEWVNFFNDLKVHEPLFFYD